MLAGPIAPGKLFPGREGRLGAGPGNAYPGRNRGLPGRGHQVLLPGEPEPRPEDTTQAEPSRFLLLDQLREAAPGAGMEATT